MSKSSPCVIIQEKTLLEQGIFLNLYLNDNKMLNNGLLVDIWWKAQIEKKLSCPSTSVEQWRTQLLSQMRGYVKIHIIFFIRRECHFPFSATLFLCPAIMRNGAFLCSLPWFCLACKELHVHGSHPPLTHISSRRPLRNYRRTVVLFKITNNFRMS